MWEALVTCGLGFLKGMLFVLCAIAIGLIVIIAHILIEEELAWRKRPKGPGSSSP